MKADSVCKQTRLPKSLPSRDGCVRNDERVTGSSLQKAPRPAIERVIEVRHSPLDAFRITGLSIALSIVALKESPRHPSHHLWRNQSSLNLSTEQQVNAPFRSDSLNLPFVFYEAIYSLNSGLMEVLRSRTPSLRTVKEQSDIFR